MIRLFHTKIGFYRIYPSGFYVDPIHRLSINFRQSEEKERPVLYSSELCSEVLDFGTSYINEVRRRAAIPGKEAAMEIKPEQLTLDFILDERARELGGEQQRWFDLKRTGKLLERVKAYNPDAKVNIKEHHLLRPIPQTQLDAIINKEEFGQNAGYN